VFVIEQNRDAAAEDLARERRRINPASFIRLHYDGTPITARYITGESRDRRALNVRLSSRRQSRMNPLVIPRPDCHSERSEESAVNHDLPRQAQAPSPTLPKNKVGFTAATTKEKSRPCAPAAARLDLGGAHSSIL